MFSPIAHHVPDEISIEPAGAGWAVIIPLTATDDGLQTASVQVRLDPTHWCGHPIHTFGFSIIAFNEETGETKEIYDRFSAAGYLGDASSLVMPCVVKATEALINAIQPEAIHRVTFVTQPHAKALHKHQMITDTITQMGYYVAKSDTDQHGRQFWIMVKEGRE